MKRVFLLLALCAVTFSCSKGSDPSIEPEPLPSEERVEVTFNLGGEIEFSIEPLSKATSSDDLYGINIYQSDDKFTIGSSPISYAYGIFDDLSDITVSLLKGKYYHFEMTYIPNGKNLVHKDATTNNYGSPFYCLTADHNGEFNKFVYADTHNWYMMCYGGVQKVGVTDYMIQSNLFNDVERYQGVLYNFYATPEDPIAKINLYRMMVGFKLIINDFTEGTVILKSSNGYSYSVSAPKGSSTATLEQVVELPMMPMVNLSTGSEGGRVGFIGWNQDFIEAEQPFPDEQYYGLYITYSDKDGGEKSLYNNYQFIYRRLKTHVLEFSLPEMIDGGIQANIMDNISEGLTETEWQ